MWLGPVISTSDPQMSHDFFWIICAVFSTQNVDWWNTTGFTAEAFFFSNKITRASSYRCVYQYMGRSVGSKWLKEYLVYIVSVDLEVYTKFDLRYDRKIRIDRLSEHL